MKPEEHFYYLAYKDSAINYMEVFRKIEQFLKEELTPAQLMWDMESTAFLILGFVENES